MVATVVQGIDLFKVQEGQPHHYLPNAMGTLTNGKLLIAEAGMVFLIPPALVA
jgi:hypothetical protein